MVLEAQYQDWRFALVLRVLSVQLGMGASEARKSGGILGVREREAGKIALTVEK